MLYGVVVWTYQAVFFLYKHNCILCNMFCIYTTRFFKKCLFSLLYNCFTVFLQYPSFLYLKIYSQACTSSHILILIKKNIYFHYVNGFKNLNIIWPFQTTAVKLLLAIPSENRCPHKTI